MKNFNYSKLYDDVNISTVCNYLYKLIQVYEIDLKLIKFTQLKKTGTADIKDIEELTGFSNYKVRSLFNEPELHIIDSSNRLQVTVDDVRSFLQDDFNKKGKYWKALKSIESKQATYTDIIMMFNQFQSLINEYNEELDVLSEKIINLDITPLDVKQISKEMNWSPRLAREKLNDPKLKTIEESNRIQVDRSVFKEYIQKNLAKAC